MRIDPESSIVGTSGECIAGLGQQEGVWMRCEINGRTVLQ